MPTLDWIGKQAVVNHDKDVPFRLLKRDPKLSVGDSQNLLIKGDNLEALKALMPYYVGKVKCIYIDPPYNTGNESWVYNDAVCSPEMQRWLGKVVGGENDDLSRHDKWLCMMYPRLKLLRDLLSEKGVFFISIDDNEVAALRFLMDEIFGESNFLAQIIVESNRRGQTYKQISKTHEYLVCYTKSDNIRLNELSTGGENLTERDDFGNYSARELRNRNPKFGRHNRPNLFYEVFVDTTKTDGNGHYKVIPAKRKGCVSVLPRNSKGKDSCWRWGREKLSEAIKSGTREIFAAKTRNGEWRIFEKYRKETVKPKTLWTETEFISEQGTNLLRELGLGEKFQFPKPLKLIERILEIATDKDSLVLDSFAGSGTTGHAVLGMNRDDGGNRHFILVEMEQAIAEKVTAKRLHKVVKGYVTEGERVAGTGGGFQFLRLDTTLFDAEGNISESVKYLDLARYVFFTEAQKDLDEKKVKKPYIGTDAEADYFLFFTEKGKNTFTGREFRGLMKKEGKKVVYADRCLVSEVNLRKANIVFKQIPYQVKVY